MAGVITLALLASGPLSRWSPCATIAAQEIPPRPFAVPDLIELARFGSQRLDYADKDYAVRSPDGSRVAVVVQRGDLTHNVVDYTLLVFRTAALLHTPCPDTVLTFASSSNEPGIAELTWLSDNVTLAFRGERAGEIGQVYTVNVRTRQLRRLTNSATPVTSFGIAAGGDPILYTAEMTPDTTDYPMRRRRGFVVTPTQFVGELVAGHWASRWFYPPKRIFVQHAGRAAVPLPDPGPEYAGCSVPDVSLDQPLSIAPTGATALVYCAPRATPDLWQQYTDRRLRDRLLGWGARFQFPRPMVLDLQRNRIMPLLDAPVWYATSIAWAPDGRSVVLANTFLPLDVADSTERAARAAGPAVAEIDVRTHAIRIIAHRDSLRVVRWDAPSNTVELAVGTDGVAPSEAQRMFYRKTPSGWGAAAARDSLASSANSPRLVIDEGLNHPPQLVVASPDTTHRVVVFDPNPGLLTRLRLAEEAIIHWRSRAGKAWSGGLYYPPGFVPGRRYPLVIQTHDFDSTRFAPEGASSTGYAAQPLAAHGVFVLQIGTDGMRGDGTTPREGPSAMAGFESAVDYLDSLGLIDRTRVGLHGWSRTSYHVKYTLIHSRYPFAAATVADGVDFSYIQYLLLEPTWVGVRADRRHGTEAELINDGPPFGRTLDVWRERAPGFTLDQVRTPLRITALRPPALLEEWEFYAGLVLQHKPVEMLYLPDGAHSLVKPQERLTSEQGAVDWFCFWLKGEEDPDPVKREQYTRWHELRRLQDQPQASDTGTARRASK